MPYYMPDTSHAPTISITTPSLNQAEFIEETIVSVLSQQGDFFIDYIIMDGGSTDASVEIIKKYDELLRRRGWPIGCKSITYRWTSGKDKGQTDAVNKGFSQAKGEILGWLNSDDTYLPGAFQKAVDYFSAHPDVVMVYGNAYYTNRKGAITAPYPSEPFDLKRLADYCYICQPSAFIRTAALKEVGEMDLSLHTCMDYDLWIRLGKKFESGIAFIEDYLATSRMYAENKTLALKETAYEESIETAKKHFGYVSIYWLNGYIIDVISGIHMKNKGQSLPIPIRKLIFMNLAMRYLLQPGNEISLFRAFKIAWRNLENLEPV